MKLIKYIQLYNYLVDEEGLNRIQAYRSIQRIRKLPAEFKQAVQQVLQGYMPNMEYNGVTLEELVETEHIKPVRAIQLLDWIRREPAVAMRYMEKERFRAPQQVSDADREKLKAAMARFNVKKKEEKPKDETDIEIEN
jgi:hypothetical protein